MVMLSTPPKLYPTSRHRRTLRPARVLVGLGLVGAFSFALLISFVLVSAVPNVTDLQRPPEEAYLRSSQVELLDDENAYLALVKAVNGSVLTGNQLVRYERTIQRGEWDQEVAEEVVESNEEALSSLSKVFQCTSSAYRYAWDQGDKYRFLSERRKDFVKLLYVVPRMLHESDRTSEALEFATAQLRLATMIKRGEGELLSYATGVSLQNGAVETLLELAAADEITRGAYDRLQQAAEDSHDDGSQIRRALKEDYAATWRQINRYVSQDFGDGDGNAFQDALRSYFFHSNRTKTELAEFYCAMLTSIDKPYSLASMPSRNPLFGGDEWSLKYFTTPNSFGDTMLSICLPPAHGVARAKSAANTRLSAVRLILAARRFTVEHDSLPETMEHLIPEYLPAVPLDDFDGQPIRFNKDRGIVYSVGRNLVDDGGDPKKDIVWSVDSFTAEAP